MLDVLDVPGAHHPVERHDYTPDTRAAVGTAVGWMARRITAETQ